MYQRKVKATVVPHIWIGAACWPFILYVGVTEFSGNGLYILLSLFFLTVTALTVYHGITALRHDVYSDFIMLSIVPLALPAILGSYFYFN